MAFAGGLGAKIDLKKVPLNGELTRDDHILFSESNSRFVVEVVPENTAAFEKAMRGAVIARIGKVTAARFLKVRGLNGEAVLRERIADLKEAWQKPLRW
jgi:phosphoribosylformylglycinamidine synthase